MLDDIIRFLICPVCGDALRHPGPAVVCSRGHSFDVARQGYLNLLTGGTRHHDADTAAMVGARERFLAAGHYADLAGRVAALGRQAAAQVPGEACVLEAGAGTGYYLAAAVGSSSGIGGVALDASKHAARRAARAHPRIGAVVADVWQRFPVRTGAAGVALVVFAPRNPPELHRVLRTQGRLIIVAPGPGHLHEVTEPLGLLRIAGDKDERLSAQLGRYFRKTGQEVVRQRLHLGEADLRSLVMMGPSAWHVPQPEAERRIGRLGGAAEVTAAFNVLSYQPVDRPATSHHTVPEPH